MAEDLHKEIEKIINNLEKNQDIFNYGDLAFHIAIISKLENIAEDITLKDFYRFLINKKSRTISLNIIEANNESDRNADNGSNIS